VPEQARKLAATLSNSPGKSGITASVLSKLLINVLHPMRAPAWYLHGRVEHISLVANLSRQGLVLTASLKCCMADSNITIST
jgi:hypothetical protein